MSLSTNSVFHFTKTKTNLKGILSSNFKIKYCFEKIYLKEININGFPTNGTIEGGIPMVSFCDIPLSQIKEHVKKYGQYSIGLKKEWAIKNKLNPVMYFEEGSHLSHQVLHTLASKLFLKKNNKNLNEEELALSEIFRYSKNNIGELFRKGKLINSNYRFSDEREWRYCPPISDLDKNPFMLSLKESEYQKVKSKYNSELSNLRLNFNPEDISYIIIKSESEISEMINHLENAKGKKYSFQDIRRLTTRIITCDQVLYDL